MADIMRTGDETTSARAWEVLGGYIQGSCERIFKVNIPSHNSNKKLIKWHFLYNNARIYKYLDI